MNIVELIRKKRDGKSLSGEEIRYLIQNYVKDNIPDYQISAFLMATFFRGMSFEETLELTNSMLHSGEVVDFSFIPGKKVDKHSTGGVGDKTSLILAPVVAAAGVYVPMISGRGLGHTGGTLDKLESIPGFNVHLPLEQFKAMVERIGVSLIGQTEEIAPADKKIYALRDVTATVECIPLITASIMSKKLAEGIDALVLDIKFGDGAFMKTIDQARELGMSLVKVGTLAGKDVIGLLTDMNQPLGNAIGNWLEVEESIQCLRGEGPEDLVELSLTLAGMMIYLGQKASTFREGYEIARQMITSGKALNKFIEIVKEHGGDVGVIEKPEQYARARFIEDILSPIDGYIQEVKAYPLGIASVELGAGRMKKEDPVDPQAGILLHRKSGDAVRAGDILCTLYSNKPIDSGIRKKVLDAFIIGPERLGKEDSGIIREVLTADGVVPWEQYL